jgi:hypothetical protein
MKKSKILIVVAIVAIAGFIAIAADHIDAPAVAGGTSDITDFYAFQGNDGESIVFVANVQGFLSPGATAAATFDENVMVEFNIDTNGDAIEDLVIQAVPKNSKMYFIGPVSPSQTGTVSQFEAKNFKGANSVQITSYGSNAIVKSKKGISVFAGPRDDPFFFDFGQFSAILGGTAGGFNDPGADTFAGTNVMSIVIEVPKSMLGGGTSINSWVESKRKQ